MLQTTHQPEPSLRHRLASRLESCLQSMHTPPAAADDAPGLIGFDPSWAIFDQNSIAMVPQSILPERHQITSHAQNGQDAAMSGIYDHHSIINQQAMGSDGQWFSPEQQADAWQSTLMRLFGNGDFGQSQNHLV
jgi:hypothetical protein